MKYEELIRHRNDTNPFARSLQIQCVEMDEGYARAEMPVSEQVLNPHGSVHGGVLFTLADVAGGSACASYGYAIATLDADFHYLRPGIGLTRLSASAHVLKRGKRICVFDVRVSDQDGTLLAAGTFTYSFLGDPIEL